MANNPVFNAYFRFLNLAEAVYASPSAPRLDAAGQRLLEALTASWNSGHALTVTETIALSAAGAPATVHRKPVSLRECGRVSMDESREDLRIKTVAPARKTLDYFKQLAACLGEIRKR